MTLKVFDILGNEIGSLVNEEKAASTYEVEFSTEGGLNSVGSVHNLPSGVYFYRLQAANYVVTKKMILMK
ncbi:MAG: T9SS type A sorting domain-containing protein [Ignavibacteriota bacterium]|nr:T9SS C-terminal target domain-containing protein [Ignavibacteriota bacterium]MCZ2270191.1 T9SS type A sorting domain-containing protein [Ignavibacteriales bacterium]QKJ98225.1 MAG: T9SS type A sorting domain-containing protein [Ignavibacteriota bacterium]